jgi:hypothetical protein
METMIWMKVPLVTGSVLGFYNFLYCFGWRVYLRKKSVIVIIKF